MSTENRETLPLPINIRGWTEKRGLVLDHQGLAKALQDLIPDLTERETGRIDYYLTDLIDCLAHNRHHLPKDVVPTPGKGELTHVLNGRLLRKNGIWIGLHFDENTGADPVQIISINRGSANQLYSILGGIKAMGRRIERRHTIRYGQAPVPKFHQH